MKKAPIILRSCELLFSFQGKINDHPGFLGLQVGYVHRRARQRPWSRAVTDFRHQSEPHA
jgi:hypothetical protein